MTNIGKLCSKITNLYKDKEKDVRLQNLIIDCIPILLKYYFNNFYDEKICSIIEVCILTIYNLSLSDENVKFNRIRIPNLSLPSVYHSPQAAPIQSELSESALSKLESEYIILEEGFKPCLDTINNEKRFNLIRFLLILYYSRFNLPTSTKLSKLYFCDMCLKMSKINRSSLKLQPIYLNSQILIEMLHGLYFLFNNNLELDSYIAIESISMMADDEVLVDVILMCNSIKNLIQQNKNEPSIQNALLNSTNSSNVNINGNSKTNRSASIISNKKKILDSNSSSPVTTQVSNLKKVDSILDSSSNGSAPSSPQSSTHYFMKSSEKNHPAALNDVYVSPSAEIRSAVRLASTKVQKQQIFETINIENLPPPLPTTPPPRSESYEKHHHEVKDKEIPIIDENIVEIDEGSNSSKSLSEKF